MFSNISDERHMSEGQSPASPTSHGVTSSGLVNQENSWIGLLSVVSRPALAFLQKYLPVPSRSPSLSDNVAGWVSGDIKRTLVEERGLLGQLDDMLPHTQHPAPRLACLQYQHDGTAGLMETRGAGTFHWLPADSLDIQNDAEVDMDISQQTQIGYFSTARTFLSHILLSSASAQEIKHASKGKDWRRKVVDSPVKSSGVGGTWWGSEESSESGRSSDLLRGKERAVTGHHCSQHSATGTKAAVAKTTELFVQGSDRESMPGENAGQRGHKEEPADNGGLNTTEVQAATAHHQPSISRHLISAGAATACSEVALLTPDQDNGYSSLEEEHNCQPHMVKDPCEEEPQQVTEWKGESATMKKETEGEICEEGESRVLEADEREAGMEGSGVSGSENEESPPQEGSSVATTVLTPPLCQNKAIAYIIGSPCSDEDDDSQSDTESSEDDDGFDSDGSSELSDSVYEDDDDEGSDSDSEADSETERLWNSLCQSRDPYNPQNFTARLHTSSTTPRTIPTTVATSASPHSTPASSPDQTPSPLSSSPASPPVTSYPLQSDDVWDDSTSASEADETESLRLWRSFSSSSDPYSPLNFQAPLRTCKPTEAGPRSRSKKASQRPPCSPHYTAAASPPQYRKEEAEERLDSGFSEPLASTMASSSTSTTLGFVTVKKVRFCEDVEEFFASCGEEEEDRRGPWEELARDRCRFLRRCQEVEQSIAYCLQPQHRSVVYQRLTVHYCQDG
ncbi:protein phosphatase 1 regulatory subunit 15B [Myripristis murdjan]|uniref:Protein phosphatase 1 regulatory subunit 15B-like n=1 Tax=Myripristis murdjan TaxID=586833 RepID=A0A667YVC2_9TELE|nr:protein phosphatase 1 regulatory subunit 15B-like [Myripristis murdjan]